MGGAHAQMLLALNRDQKVSEQTFDLASQHPFTQAVLVFSSVILLALILRGGCWAWYEVCDSLRRKRCLRQWDLRRKQIHGK